MILCFVILRQVYLFVATQFSSELITVFLGWPLTWIVNAALLMGYYHIYSKKLVRGEDVYKRQEELSKLVDSTKAAYDAVQAQWNQGSLAFYESIGDTQASEVIKEGIQLGKMCIRDRF